MKSWWEALFLMFVHDPSLSLHLHQAIRFLFRMQRQALESQKAVSGARAADDLLFADRRSASFFFRCVTLLYSCSSTRFFMSFLLYSQKAVEYLWSFLFVLSASFSSSIIRCFPPFFPFFFLSLFALGGRRSLSVITLCTNLYFR